MKIVELTISVIAALSGIFALIISLLGINKYQKKQNYFLAVDRFLSDTQSETIMNAKNYIYSMKDKPEEIDISDNNAALVANHLHHWGLLAKRGYLPLWVFYDGSGGGVVRLYTILENYIEKRRAANEDETLFMGFEWLYSKFKTQASIITEK